MKLHIRNIIISLVILGYGSLNYADAEEILTLDNVLSMAYESNPSMIETGKNIEAAKGDLITARALPDPEVEFEIDGFKEKEDGGRNLNLGNIGIKQGFDPFGTRGLKGKIAKNEISIQEESVRVVWSEIYLKVREYYNKIILDKKQLELATDNLNILRQFYSRVDMRFQSGNALKNELQRAHIELLEAETKYLAFDKDIKTDKARLNLLLGRAVDTSFDISEELKDEELEFNFKELVELAFVKRPDIKQEELNFDSKTKNLTKEELNRLPSTFIGFDRVTEDYEDDYTITIGLSMPLWNFNQGEIKKAAAEKEKQEIKVDTLKREVVMDVYEAYLNAELAHRQFELLKKSLEEANELFRLADLHYSEGEIDFINFLDQVRTANQTRIKYYEGLFNLSNAISQLEKAAYASLREEDYLK